MLTKLFSWLFPSAEQRKALAIQRAREQFCVREARKRTITTENVFAVLETVDFDEARATRALRIWDTVFAVTGSEGKAWQALWSFTARKS